MTATVIDLAGRRVEEPAVPVELTDADASTARQAAVTYGADLDSYLLGRYRTATEGAVAALAASGRLGLQADAELSLRRLVAFDRYAQAYLSYLRKRGR